MRLRIALALSLPSVFLAQGDSSVVGSSPWASSRSSASVVGRRVRGQATQEHPGSATAPSSTSSIRPSKSRGLQGFDVAVRRFVVGLRGGAVVSDPYNARMQVMITRNMKKVLVEELDYLPDEVDDMDPQIAAVVIEKSLPRPRAGMPVVWRKSIRSEAAKSNPLASLAGAIEKAAGAALNTAVAVLGFPFRVAGGVRDNGAKGVVTVVVVVALVAAVVTSSDSGDTEDTSPGSSPLGALGNMLADAKALSAARVVWPVRGGPGGGSGGDGDDEGGKRGDRGEAKNTPSKDRKDGGAAVGAGRGRWFGRGKFSDSASEENSENFPTAESSSPPPNKRSAGAKKKPTRFSSRDPKISAASPNSPEKTSREKQQQRKGYYGQGGDYKSSSGFRGSAGRGGDARSGDTPYASGSYDGDDEDSDEIIFSEFPSEEVEDDLVGDGDEWRYPADEDQRVGASKRTDRGSFGGQGVGGRGLVERSTEELHEKPAALDSWRTGGAGGVEGRKGGLEGAKGKARRRMGRRGAGGNDSGDEDEVCPDAPPMSPDAGGAVWFEDLPPAPPAPSTIGVLEEGEGGGAMDERPRWGRKPLSEHIPSEEEMATWDSKLEASDTWLDRGINNVMGSLFGGGKDDGDNQ